MSRFLLSLAATVVGASPVLSVDLIAPPGDPRPPGPIRATATLTVDASNPGDVTANVHVEFHGYYAVTEQSPVQQDAAGRFLLTARVEPVAVIQIFPPPPFPVAELKYSLGAVPRGNHVAVFKMNGIAFAEEGFTVGDPLPKVEARVTAKVESTNAGSVAHVRIELPDPYFEMTDPGQPVRDGQRIKINATFVPINTLVAIPAPKIIEQDYRLGPLPRGEYLLVYKINGATTLEHRFTVGAPPPPPDEVKLAFIQIRTGPASTTAAVGLILPPGKVVTDWGEVKSEEKTFRAVVTIGDGPTPGVDPPMDPAEENAAGVSLDDDRIAILPQPTARHLYSLGSVAEGEYLFELYVGERLLGSKPFKVEPQPPPPPPPRPIVAFIKPGQVEGAWFVDVGLAFPRPGLEVNDWGTPKLDGNRFDVDILIGTATPPPNPVDPPPGGTPVFLGPPIPAGVAASPEWAADALPFLEIGDWPTRFVRHRYELGRLEPGEYLFVVALNGEPSARHGFVVASDPVPGPSITVRAADIEKRSDEPHEFSILYEAPAGFKTDPTEGTVTVHGPHGFEARAVLTGSVPSLDAIGRMILCHYAVEGPGGNWNAADTGDYSVCVDPEFVVDRNGRTLRRPCAFGWHVRIRPEPPPHKEASVVVSMADGIWQAEVEFENTGGWFDVEWGDPHVLGPVFVARAALKLPPPGSLVPIPASFKHTYDLGELKPGRYLFLFLSDGGHIGFDAFGVPGVEPPTPLAQWKLNALGAMAGDDAADDDNDGLPLFAEFYLGCQPDRPDPPPITAVLVTGPDGQSRLAMDFRRVNAGDGSVRCAVEVSEDMVNWRDAGSDVTIVEGAPDLDGTQPMRAMQQSGRWPFMRLKLEQTTTAP